MIKLLTNILVGLCLCSCERSAPHVDAGQAFIKKYSNEVRASKGWVLIGSGGGFYNDINKLSFHFNTFDQVNIEKAREIILSSIEDLLSAINSDSSLFPYLHEIPFKIENIILDVGFSKINSIWESVDPPLIACVLIVDGKISYSIHDECKGLKTIHRETYEEACEIVRAQQQAPKAADAQ